MCLIIFALIDLYRSILLNLEVGSYKGGIMEILLFDAIICILINLNSIHIHYCYYCLYFHVIAMSVIHSDFSYFLSEIAHKSAQYYITKPTKAPPTLSVLMM